MIVMVMVTIMAMRDAHAPRNRRIRHPAHNPADDGARGPPTAPPETAPTPAPLNLSPVVEQAARLSAAKPAKAKLRKDIDILQLLLLRTILDRPKAGRLESTFSRERSFDQPGNAEDAGERIYRIIPRVNILRDAAALLDFALELLTARTSSSR